MFLRQHYFVLGISHCIFAQHQPWGNIMDLQTKIFQICEKHFEEIVEIRRDIHRHPEVGFEVERTASIVAAELRKLNLEVKEHIGRTGVVADLNIPGATSRIALRADMDALPMQELGTPEYRSVYDGKAHMCGHDAHTAMLIGASRVLSEMQSHLKCHVRFIFQPNEENLPGGAPAMILDGAITDVDEIFGLHVWPLLPTGTIGICEGPALAQPDVFEIEITGIGGHAAAPHHTVDPVVVGAQFISSAQTIISRNSDPLDSAVVSITQFHAGDTHNVIPVSAHISGTVRTFKKEVQQHIHDRLKELLTGVCKAHGAKGKLHYQEGYPVTFNHPSTVQKVLAAAKSIITTNQINYPAPPVLGGEDFAYYTREIPGCFIFLGIRNPEKNIVYMCHDPRFDVDENAMRIGMALHAAIALNYQY
jgi:amidohydrolase